MPLELDGVALEVQLDDAGRVEHGRAAHAEVEERPPAVAHHLVEQRSQGAQVGHQQPAPQLAGALVASPAPTSSTTCPASASASAVARIAAAMPRVGVTARRLGDDGDTQGGTGRRLGQLDGERQRIADVGAGDGEQPGADVGDVAGHHALDGHQLEHDRLLHRRQRRGVRARRRSTA